MAGLLAVLGCLSARAVLAGAQGPAPGFAPSLALALFAGACLLAGGETFATSPAWVLFSLLLTVLLAVCALSDLQSGMIPDIAVLGLGLSGLALLLLTGATPRQWITCGICVAGLAALVLVQRRGSALPAIGEGDLLLLAALTPWLTPYHLLRMTLLAAVLQLLLFVGLAIAGRRLSGQRQPLAPALFVSTLAIWSFSG